MVEGPDVVYLQPRPAAAASRPQHSSRSSSGSLPYSPRPSCIVGAIVLLLPTIER